MIELKQDVTPESLVPKMNRMWSLSAEKIRLIERSYNRKSGSPVFTARGEYTTRGWTEWTQGFQYGAAVLQFDATREKEFLELGRNDTVQNMAAHVSHVGVHDHGFNNLSTYGNLLRLMREGVLPENAFEKHFYELAIKTSAAVQASRWTDLGSKGGYIYSFNGPHSLFVDTMRTIRILGVGHQLGHVLMGESDKRISLLDRLITHARTTSNFIVYYGEGRDSYDVRGRAAHEAVFNVNDGNFRCPSTQQGYSAFSTWTRGLAWAILGYAEELEFLETLPEEEFATSGGFRQVEQFMLKAALACSQFYLEFTPTDGVPYWDTGAPNLHKLGDYLSRPADPFNDFEPVDSSAAAITSQGLMRLGRYITSRKNSTAEESKLGKTFFQAGLTVLNTLLDEPYLSTNKSHQGLLLHSIYHRPNNWDYTPEGSKIPRGESSMWGDYHIREAALYVQRLVEKKPYLTFYLQ